MRDSFPIFIRCLWRHRLLPLGLAITVIGSGVIALAIGSSSPGGGVDDTAVFELDGNALDDATITVGSTTLAAPGDDWQDVYHSVVGGTPTAHTSVTSYVHDGINSQSDNAFLGASSKDTQDITQWTWTGSKPQAKDDIADAFAASYTLANGHTAVYAGMDRFDGSGDATAGFWFVQDSTFDLCLGVGKGSRGDNTACKASGTFAGKHTVGDLLLVSDFSTGGAVSTINVFVWNGAGVDLDKSRSPAPCDPVGGANVVCGTVNSAAGVATGGWGFLDKSRKTTFLAGEFLEVGLDLNAIFPNGAPCFSTFFAETRSSTSVSASLSDLTAPVSFPLCSFKVAKTCDGPGTVNGNSVDYSWTVTATNSGSAPLYDVTAADTLPDGTTTTITVVGPNTTPNVLAKNSSVTAAVKFTATTSNVKDPTSVTNTLTGGSASTTEGGVKNVAATPATGTMFDAPTCTASVSSVINLTKVCDVNAAGGGTILTTSGCSGSDVCVEVFFKTTATNNGNDELDSIALSDTPAATFDGGTYTTTLNKSAVVTASGGTATIDKLQPGDSVTITGHYFPTSIDQSGVPGRFLFVDKAEVTAATGALGKDPAPLNSALCPQLSDLACATVTMPNSTNVGCPICPNGSCQ